MDLISRQAAINLAKDIRVPTKDGTFWRHRCIDPDDIRGLPSAYPLDPCETCLHKGNGWDEVPCDGCTQNDSKYEPDNGWIPVSERLPEKDGRYLVTCSKIGAWEVDWNIWHNEPKPSWLWEQGITAWMPLPDPYKEEDR